MRYEEVVRGGSMVLTFPARSIVNPTSEDGSALMGILGQSLVDLLKEGLVQESDVNSFNTLVRIKLGMLLNMRDHFL
ncbi:hypothetical protein L1987_16046 [Smallanthus sonchifolius]|uniref:Uncharacterized protein n=1 Tax=Smallanthus sonchifolius TaxID=185202 RepID=A0ACB9J7A2_9ASTR|nr:hypothetical protein L1987_16046 [Smallanthus sonchifolius]